MSGDHAGASDTSVLVEDMDSYRFALPAHLRAISPPRVDDHEYRLERAQASAYLQQFRPGNPALVTDANGHRRATVRRVTPTAAAPLHLDGDGELFQLDADDLASGRCGVSSLAAGVCTS